ncbi:hypothetical protein T07_13382 [Trichinella nelsoni]|uniref:Uncharacterized protein n=1 Tax=Trichinella nelsoni TaxID=6336 RepID=A0A0V0SHD5_9BILA|nr:hypothetical protein T07_2188 [Trichinella nelsoni]KRX25967.1 hypothetical protein T07_13382 [Trichinella nelsoni]
MLQIMFHVSEKRLGRRSVANHDHVSEKRLRRRNADENKKKQSSAWAQYKTEPEERPSADCAWRARSVRSVAVERVRALVVMRHCFVCLLDRRSADKVYYNQDCIL